MKMIKEMGKALMNEVQEQGDNLIQFDGSATHNLLAQSHPWIYSASLYTWGNNNKASWNLSYSTSRFSVYTKCLCSSLWQPYFGCTSAWKPLHLPINPGWPYHTHSKSIVSPSCHCNVEPEKPSESSGELNVKEAPTINKEKTKARGGKDFSNWGAV